MTAEVCMIAISVQLGDDAESLVDILHIFGFVVLGYGNVDIPVGNKFATLIQLMEFPVYTLQNFLHDQAVYYSEYDC